jgi:hypothetical protein
MNDSAKNKNYKGLLRNKAANFAKNCPEKGRRFKGNQVCLWEVGSISYVEDSGDKVNMVDYNSEDAGDLEESLQECIDSSSATSDTSSETW